jgi:hypothetical protein
MASLLTKIKNKLTKSNETSSSANSTVYANVNTIDYSQPVLTTAEMLSLSYLTRSIQMISNDIAKVD